jgi:hypothetical protein
MLPIATAEVVTLVTVTVCTALAVPTFRMVLKATEVGETLIGVTAVPVTLTDCGLPVPLYATEMLPVCAPVAVAVGAKVTLRVQVEPAATEVHPVAANSGLLLETVTGSAAVVLFLSVKVLAALVVPWATEPKLREVGVMVIGATPVPVRAMVKGLPAPLYITVMLPVCAPIAVGVKVTLILHVPLAATEAPQVLVATNSVDEDAMVTGTAVVELFVSVIFFAALVEPTPVEPKLSEVVESVMTPIPVPLRVTVCVAGDALSVTTTLPVAAPSAVGLKVILILHVPLAATDAPQVLVSAKGALATMFVIASAVVVLVFVRVTLNVELVLPTPTEPKL